MYQSYSLSRYIDGDTDHGTTFTVADDDPINCAHMLAAGFNTISRNTMGDFVLGVVDTKTGIVQYDGKYEQIKRADPWSVSQPFTFEPSEGDADTILTLFGNGETPTFTAAGKMSFADETTSAVAADKVAPTMNRKVLEDAYVELHTVKDVLFDAGVETIPADAGVQTLVRRLEHEEHARHAYEEANGQANEAARAELIAHVKGAYDKWSRIDPDRERDDLKSHLRGMIEVLSKFLVVIGEADDDERHAVAKRLCGIPEGTYLYDAG